MIKYTIYGVFCSFGNKISQLSVRRYLDMKASKRIFTLLLALVLLVSASVPALAAGFTDVPDSYWAKDYIDVLDAAGYLSGYEDGSFRPGGRITVCETLVILSRFYTLDELALQQISSDYLDTVKAIVPGSLSWAANELCIALAAGIVTPDELSTMSLSTAITKADFALFLVRAMQMDDDISAAGQTVLPFEDAASITGVYRGSVAILYNAGIVDGDEHNRFNPTQTVTRAVASAMVYRALTFLSQEQIVLSIPAYSSLGRCKGLLRSVDAASIRVEQFNGTVREFTFSASSKFTVNGTAATLSDALTGQHITLTAKDAAILTADITVADNVKYLSGTVYSVSTTANGTINIVPSGDYKPYYYTLVSGAAIQLNGAASSISGLNAKDHAVIKLTGNQVSEIYAYNYSSTLTGTISSFSFGTTVSLKLTDANKNVWPFDFAIAELPEISVGSYTITIDRLAVGDELTVHITNGAVTKLVGSSAEASAKGTISSMIETIDGLSWEITDTAGVTHRYPVAEGATAHKGSTAILLSTIKVGDTVSVTLFNGSITSVKLESTAAGPQSGKLTGTLLNADALSRKLILLISDKLYYVNVPGAVPVYNAATGKSLSLSQITADSSLVVYGTYENATTLSATLIVVETLAALG